MKDCCSDRYKVWNQNLPIHPKIIVNIIYYIFIETTSKGGLWQYYINGDWKNYSEEDNYRIEKLYTTKKQTINNKDNLYSSEWIKLLDYSFNLYQKIACSHEYY